MAFNIKITLLNGLKAVGIFAIPVLIAYFSTTGIGGLLVIDLIVKSIPALGSLTVAGVLTMLLDYLKHKNDK